MHKLYSFYIIGLATTTLKILFVKIRDFYSIIRFYLKIFKLKKIIKNENKKNFYGLVTLLERNYIDSISDV